MKSNSFKPFISLLTSMKLPKVHFSIGLIGTIIFTIVGLTIPLLIKGFIDGFSLESLSPFSVVVIITFFILQAVFDGITTYTLSYVGQFIIANLRERLWLKLTLLPVGYFDENTSGELVSRVVNDTSIVRKLVAVDFPQFIRGLLTIIASVTILFILDWQMTLIVLIVIPVSVAVWIPIGKRISAISSGLQDETANFTGIIQQTLGEIRLMKMSTAELMEQKRGKVGIHSMFHFGIKEARILALLSPLMYSIMMTVTIFLITYGSIRVMQESMSLGTLIAFVIYALQISDPISMFSQFFAEFQKAKGATQRIIQIFNLPNEKGSEGKEIDIADKTICISNISFSYKKGENVLQNITFDASPGEKVAIVGPSGAGKTTLFALLERFYEPEQGEIFIGDIPVHALSLESWRSQIGYVSQESAMLAGTIRENLIYGLPYGEKIPDDKLWGVLRMAFADEFINNFSERLETRVGERGVKLSGGQRQRINIARAFLRDPKILMLDEATASLDSQSESMVQEALYRLMVGRTTLVIAHRLSTILDADKIIFIEGGKITGCGTHSELLDTHPLYRDYAESQLA